MWVGKSTDGKRGSSQSALVNSNFNLKDGEMVRLSNDTCEVIRISIPVGAILLAALIGYAYGYWIRGKDNEED